MLAAHVENEVDVTVGCIGVPKSQARSFGVMQVDEKRRIVKFEEKPRNPDALPGASRNMVCLDGHLHLQPKFLDRQVVRDAARSDFEPRFRQGHHPRRDWTPPGAGVFLPGTRTAPARATGADVGTVDAFWQANIELIEVAPELNLYDTLLADLDLPGAAAAGQVRIRRPRPSRYCGQLDGLGRLHRRRLHAQALAGLLQRDQSRPIRCSTSRRRYPMCWSATTARSAARSSTRDARSPTRASSASTANTTGSASTSSWRYRAGDAGNARAAPPHRRIALTEKEQHDL